MSELKYSHKLNKGLDSTSTARYQQQQQQQKTHKKNGTYSS